MPLKTLDPTKSITSREKSALSFAKAKRQARQPIRTADRRKCQPLRQSKTPDRDQRLGKKTPTRP
jgi:hypothetical protein